MKKILALFFILSFLVSCSSMFYGTAESVGKLTKKEISFVAKFETAVLKHKGNKIIALLDKQYKKEQYAGFYKRDKQRFLDEFFCGKNQFDKFSCLKLAEIQDVRLIEVRQISDTQKELVFMIKGNNEKIKVSFVLQISANRRLGIVGAYG